ncbi:uncharacterized protein LOC134535524 isoform X1 [Bacillus rossius redtenbacheri]|uniref:uncharacterized protein LOC134535524 isoform X1 n=1 Tax=Bacillus rossius redtenbacheri TaxID=93214 RepID=UPI002FDED317
MRDGDKRKSVLQSLLEWECAPPGGDMTLPVSSYEELLARVRSITHETIQLQRELASPLLDHNDNERVVTSSATGTCDNRRGVACASWGPPTASARRSPPPAERDDPGAVRGGAPAGARRRDRQPPPQVENGGSAVRDEMMAASLLARLGVALDRQGVLVRLNNKENVMDEPKEEDERRMAEACRGKEGDAGERDRLSRSGPEPRNERQGSLSSLYHGTWPVERTLWHSGPSSLGAGSGHSFCQDAPSVMSFSSGAGSPVEGGAAARRCHSQQQLGAKVEMVYGLLSMLGAHDKQDMSRTLLAMSGSPDSCLAMRQSGCLPLLVQLLHGPDGDAETRRRAAQALHNVVHADPEDKHGRREARVLRLLEQARAYCDALREEGPSRPPASDEMEKHPGPTIAALMKLSFDEEHRLAMCQLGGLHTIAELIQVDHEAHGSLTKDQYCVTLRRYAGMALTNLTFGDGTNKALLCSLREFMSALVAQLDSPSEDLRQVTASVLRNLSWRADGCSKQTLREVGAVPALMKAAMEGKKESTLKSILSALWNLSAHCSMNKVDICAVDGALAFLVGMLSYKAPSKTLAIVENAGGILRNISSHIAVREDYRAVLREHNCLQVLLHQLKSPSLTIVSNACGTLWNLSARCLEDQKALWELGAVNMLRSLVHSKHKMISMGSSAALKNLLSARPASSLAPLDPAGRGSMPGLFARKQKALEQELDQSLAETCDNIEPNVSPSSFRDDRFVFSATDRQYRQRVLHHAQQYQQQLMARYHARGVVARSDSRDSVTSTLSDTVFERVSRSVGGVQGSPTDDAQVPLIANPSSLTGSLSETGHVQYENVAFSDRRFLRRYCNSMKDSDDGRRNGSSEQTNEDNANGRERSRTGSLDSSYQRTKLDQIDEGTPAGNEHDEDTTKDPHKGTSVKNSLQESCPSIVNSSKDLGYESGRTYSRQSVFSPLEGGTSSCGSSHIQYQQVNRIPSSTQSFTSPRSKFPEYTFEEQEQPVDYSLKYVENDSGGSVAQDCASGQSSDIKNKTPQPASYRDCVSETGNSSGHDNLGQGFSRFRGHCVPSSKNVKMSMVYGDYAETDLDQLTDYSLKYAEEVDESEFEKNAAEGQQERERYLDNSVPMQEDTLKTYCTEGTPYETPYNFSTATSMSDLRCDTSAPHQDLKDESTEETKEDSFGKDGVENAESAEVVGEEASTLNQSDADKEPQEKFSSVTAPALPSRLSSGLSSGLMSPEKPVQYCEEGTPGCFSRVSSLSSLSSLPVHSDTNRTEVPVSNTRPEPRPEKKTSNPTAPTEEVKEEPHADREGKVVTFGGADHYAEETPLMFSRCSSLGSLSSFEQHSIHDDRSSVISDFSRRTSGVVSPSELPDSPTQSVPGSPSHQKPPVEFTSQIPDGAGASGRAVHQPAARHPLPGRSNTARMSVFEDDVAAFKEEDTPVEFSRATSLSSLTIDDEPKISNDAMLKEVVKLPPRAHASHLVRDRGRDKDKDEEPEKQDTEKEKKEPPECSELATVSEGEEETDEDMLAACINIGMQNSRQRPGSRASTSGTASRPLSYPRSSGIPVRLQAPGRPARQQPANYIESAGGPCDDALQTYHTEGTPANISQAGSHSDLSVLSVEESRLEGVTEERPADLSDDSSNDNILAECIQSGMPKAREPPRRRLVTPTPDGTPKKPPSRRPASHHLCGLDHGHPPAQPAGRLFAARPVRDEVKTFATEGTPNTLSPGPSLADLTANKSPQNDAASRFPAQDVSLEVSHAASLSSLSIDEEDQLEAPNVSGVRSPESSSDIATTAVCPVDVASEPPVQSMIVSSDGSWCDHIESAASRQYNKTSSASEDVVTILSRNGSLSSLSVDSFGSTEPTPSEQALLEQCINSGMPKGCIGNKASRMPVPIGKKRVGCKSPFSPLNRSVEGDKLEVVIPIIPIQKLELKPSSLITCHNDMLSTAQFEEDFSRLSLEENMPGNVPKNVQDPSAAMSINSTAIITTTTITTTTTHANLMDTVAGAEEDTEEKDLQNSLESIEVNRTTRERICTVGGVTVNSEVTHKSTKADAAVVSSQNDSLASPVNDKLEENSQEECRSDVSVDLKHQDLKEEGDAMILSLDRMTQSLLHQVQDRKEMKQSTVGSDTWNEDTSPNDISFPSMSISAPLITSFKSDNCDAASTGLPELVEEEDTVSMTDSHMLELEASKLAVAVRNEANSMPSDEMDHSMTSIDLDAIKPPSMMGSLVSLTTSFSGHLDIMECAEARDKASSSSLPVQPAKSSNRVDCRHHRKKSLPVGMMMRRALGNNLSSSLENLLDNSSVSSSCNSHLDNIKPPSAMEELADMENSMVSVASITSEVADSSSNKEHSNSEQSPASSDAIFDLLRPAATIMAEVYAAHCANMAGSVHTTSTSDCLDNINPPSAFDEITDIVAHEPGTETICSDTEMLMDDVAQPQDEVDGTELLLDGSRKSTPVQSAANSADSTPKKLLEKPKQLTPKQKRLLVKDRYKTYTIDGDEEIKERNSQQIQMDKKESKDLNKTITVSTDGDGEHGHLLGRQEEQTYELMSKSPVSTKVTPKQRRQEDRERFQTRVLNKLPNGETEQGVVLDDIEDECLTYTFEENADSSFIMASCTSELQSEEVVKTVKQKRAQARDRFQTRTLSEEMQAVCLETEQPPFTSFGTNTYGDEKSTLENNYFGIMSEEIETLLERDANIVISSINETRRRNSESSEVQSDDNVLLDCETLSLISLESESDHNATGYSRVKRFIGHSDSVDEEPEVLTAEKNEQKEIANNEHLETESSGSEDEDDFENEYNINGPRKPRIIKPGSSEGVKRDESLETIDDDVTTQNSPKPVRGRRKALYSNLSSKRSVPASSDKSRSSIPIVSGNAVNSSGGVRPTRASTLRQTGRGSAVVSHRSVSRTPPSSSGSGSPRNTSPKTYKSQKAQQREQKPKMSAAAKPPVARGSSTSKNASMKRNSVKLDEAAAVGTGEVNPIFRPPERQGTFTKDEPSTPNTLKMFIPSPSSSPTKTRIPVPSSDKPVAQKQKKQTAPKSAPAATNRPQLRREMTRQSPRVSAQARMNKALSQDCSSIGRGNKSTTAPGRNPNRKSCVSNIRPSLSNQSLNSNEGKSGRKSMLGGSQQSSSNCSLNSTSSVPAGKNSSTKKEVTSKIASLWKRVEESKAKQNAMKDNHVWITAECGTPVQGTCESPPKPSPPKLVRSSTFEGIVPGSGAACNGIPKASSKQVAKSRGASGDKRVAEVTGIVQPSSRLHQEGCKPVADVVYRRPRDLKSSDNDVQETEEEKAKRLSRLGTFIRIEPPEGGGEDCKVITKIPASAVVPPFNYNPPAHIPGSLIPTHFSSTLTKRGGGDSQDSSEISDQDFSTASLKVTTV